MANKNETEISHMLLSKLPKLEVDAIGEGAADRFRFEHSLLTTAGLSHDTEATLVKQAVGERAAATEQPSEESDSDGE
jgi:hypothetical protein